MRLSILDQTPIRHGSNAVEALQESVALISLADRLGYTRYWLSEHHNISTLAAAAPEVLIPRLAAGTSHIRIGAGGIMLPNHSALKVAENFRLLEALFPGRIDLGLGRAPGGDRLTAQWLNPSNTFNPSDYIQQIMDLQQFLDPANAGPVKAIPLVDTVPELWMLTSSGESALLAAHFGMSLGFAKFINPVGAREAIDAYRRRFREGIFHTTPQAAIGIFVFCSEDDEKIQRAQALMDYRLLHIGAEGKSMPSFEMANKHTYTPAEVQQVLFNRGRMVVGNPAVVKAELTELAESCEVDELIISTFSEHAADRLLSYELLADIFSLDTTVPSREGSDAALRR